MKDEKGEQLAVIANHVAEARYWLSVPEQRLILWLVGQIEREDDAFRSHVLSVAEMESVIGSNNGRIYEQLEVVCDKLQKRVLEIYLPDEGIRRKINWLEEVDYIDGKGKITLKIHGRLKSVFLQLHEQFCKIPLKSVFRLRGGYAIRWLEMVYAQKHYKTWDMTVDELRSWLGIDAKELPAVKDLRARAIDVPRKELDEKSEWSFTYIPKRLGRAITGWTFTVRANKPKQTVTKNEKVASEQATSEQLSEPTTDRPSFRALWDKSKEPASVAAEPAAASKRVKVTLTPEEMAAREAVRKSVKEADEARRLGAAVSDDEELAF